MNNPVFAGLASAALAAALASAQDPGLLSAHRGGRGEFDENTMTAFWASYEAGLRGFETDVRFTSDRELVLIHDSTLTRTTTSSGTVENMTAAELAPVRTKQGNPLPFLTELLDYFADKPVYIELEMKTSDAALYPAPVLTNYCQKLRNAAVAKLTNKAVIVYASFDTRALQIMKNLFPEARTQYIGSGCTSAFISSALALSASQMACVITDSTRTSVQAAQAAGLTVVGYPVGTLRDYLLALGLGCDVICTDIPVALITNAALRSVATQVTGVSAFSLGDYLWRGAVDGIWDTASANWLASGAPAAYASSSRSNATFDDTALTRTVTCSGALWADAVVFSNATDYTLAGGTLIHAESFVKKGAGKLRITGGAHTFAGGIEVAAGALEVSAGNAVVNVAKGALGNPQANRQISVHSGATLALLVSDVLGQLSSLVKCELAVSNATLKLGAGACNVFGPLTLHNAAVSYTSGSAGSRLWGVLGFGGKTVFDGTAPYVFTANGSACVFNLGYALGTVKLSDKLYAGQTEIEVRDITRSADPDVTFFVPVQDIPDWNTAGNIFYRCGLLKGGAGTLRLAGLNTFSGDTLVTQGVLRVDGLLTNSPVAVAAGGWLAGTGTVAGVTLAEGAGFEAYAGQALPLNAGAFTAAGSGKVVVRNPTGISPAALNAPFLQVPAAQRDAVEAVAWTVTMDGADPGVALCVHVSDAGVAYARMAGSGTALRVW